VRTLLPCLAAVAVLGTLVACRMTCGGGTVAPEQTTKAPAEQRAPPSDAGTTPVERRRADVRPRASADATDTVPAPLPAKRTMHEAVELGLGWLARNQASDGRWSAPDLDPGVTGLALLCFLGVGDTHNSGQHRATVKAGLRYLKHVQDEDGCFGPRAGELWSVSHAPATLAMTEAYGLTGSRLFKDPAQRGVSLLEATRGDDGVWRAWTGRPEDDVTLTFWSALALLSADMSELEVDVVRLRTVADLELSTFGLPRGAEAAPSASEAAVLVLRQLGRRLSSGPLEEDALLESGRERLAAHPPAGDRSGAAGTDLSLCYRGTLAAFHGDDAHWGPWSVGLATLPAAMAWTDAGDRAGSFDPPRTRVWPPGGVVQSTAHGVLALACLYRTRAFLRPRR
jgi:hypothetical protein